MLRPGEEIGGCRIERVLGEGGMGTVYVATQLSTGRQRALKVMLPTFAQNAQYVERFATEARVGSRIQSEHVVEVVAAGFEQATQTPWLMMELLEGQSLDELVTQRGALPPQEVLQLFEQTCHGLAAAHAAGIVHRDLKPENLFIAKARRVGLPFVVKILDFGIAKLMQESMTVSGSQAIGTPFWMAPEQTQVAGRIGPRTDIWALGLVAFYAVTGRPYWLAAQPGHDATLAQFLAEATADEHEPPSVRIRRLGLSVTVTHAFDAWFQKCLQRNPDARFESVDRCLEGLRLALSPAHAPTAQVGTMVLNAQALPSMQNWAGDASQGGGRSAPGTPVPMSHAGHAQQPAGGYGSQPGGYGSQPGGYSHPGYGAQTAPGYGSGPGGHGSSAPGGYGHNAAYNSQASYGSSFPGNENIDFSPPRGNRTALYVGVVAVGLLVVGTIGVVGAAIAIDAVQEEDDDDDDDHSRRADRDDPPADDGYQQALNDCQTAIVAQNPDRAVQRATDALTARPGDESANGCRTQALALQQEQTTYRGGVASLNQGAYDRAYETFAQLPTGSAYRQRPEIGRAAQALADQRISQAQSILRPDPARAFLLARSVTRMHDISASQMSRAGSILEQARRVAGEVYEGRVVSARGVDTSSGTCTVSVQASNVPDFSCRILIRCGSRLVYGADNSGYNHCSRRGSAFVSANDPSPNDGDPAMRFDLATRQVHVEDRRIELQLSLVEDDAPMPAPPTPSTGPMAPLPSNPF